MLNAGNVAADKQVTFVAREEGGARIPGSTANFRVVIRQDELSTTKKLALRQPAGTMIQIGVNFYVVGIDPVITSAGNLNGLNNLADDGACTIITMAIEVHDPTGLVYAAAASGSIPGIRAISAASPGPRRRSAATR